MPTIAVAGLVTWESLALPSFAIDGIRTTTFSSLLCLRTRFVCRWMAPRCWLRLGARVAGCLPSVVVGSHRRAARAVHPSKPLEIRDRTLQREGVRWRRRVHMCAIVLCARSLGLSTERTSGVQDVCRCMHVCVHGSCKNSARLQRQKTWTV